MPFKPCFFELKSQNDNPSHLSVSSTRHRSNPTDQQNNLEERSIKLPSRVQVPAVQRKFSRRALGTTQNFSGPSTEPAVNPSNQNESLPQSPLQNPQELNAISPGTLPEQPVPDAQPPTIPPAPIVQHQGGTAPSPTTAPFKSQTPALSEPGAAATSVIYSESSPHDQPTPLPIAHHIMNLSNSSQVIFVPSHASYSSSTNPEAHTPAFGQHQHKHDYGTKPSTTLPLAYYVAFILPAIFLFVLSAVLGYRCTQRKKHHGNSLHSKQNYNHQGIPSENFGVSQGFESMAQAERHSTNSSSSCAKGYEDMRMCSIISEESKAYPVLPPLPGSSPLLSSPLKKAFGSSTTANNEKLTNPLDFQASNEGTPCKKSCIVTRTFAPTFPDELMIGIGDRVIVYLLFDDGWCLGGNLDIDKHQTSQNEQYSRMGVLPQDCLSGLDPKYSGAAKQASVINSSSAIVDNQLKSQHEADENRLEALAELEDQLASPDVSFLSPIVKPQRASSLHADREANLYFELERALASGTQVSD